MKKLQQKLKRVQVNYLVDTELKENLKEELLEILKENLKENLLNVICSKCDEIIEYNNNDIIESLKIINKIYRSDKNIFLRFKENITKKCEKLKLIKEENILQMTC